LLDCRSYKNNREKDLQSNNTSMQADRLRKPQTDIKGDRERGVPPQLSTAEENKKMA
jgi:hypothetical protein